MHRAEEGRCGSESSVLTTPIKTVNVERFALRFHRSTALV